MTSELDANKALVRRLLEDGLTGGDLDLVGELVSPDVVTHDPLVLDAPTGADSIRGGFEMLRQSFPDLDVEILDMLAEGDRVATFLRMSGTNTGAYRRGGATGRRGTIRRSSSGESPAGGSSRTGESPTVSTSSSSSG